MDSNFLFSLGAGPKLLASDLTVPTAGEPIDGLLTRAVLARAGRGDALKGYDGVEIFFMVNSY